MRTAVLIALFASLAAATAVRATGFGKPCTSEPEEKWLKIEELEKKAAEQGYTVAKSKIKNQCAEIYARDKQGNRIELFLDPATGNIVGRQ